MTILLKKTGLIDQLADEEMEVLGVIMAVKLALYDYNETLNQPMVAMMMQMRKPKLIETILGEDSDAIQEARDLYKKIEKEGKSEK